MVFTMGVCKRTTLVSPRVHQSLGHGVVMTDPTAPEVARKFSYETIADMSVRGGYHYRVRDAADNRIATCYVEENAQFIVDQLNVAAHTEAAVKAASEQARERMRAIMDTFRGCPDHAVEQKRCVMCKGRGQTI